MDALPVAPHAALLVGEDGVVLPAVPQLVRHLDELRGALVAVPMVR
jgi:hypothetical protein